MYGTLNISHFSYIAISHNATMLVLCGKRSSSVKAPRPLVVLPDGALYIENPIPRERDFVQVMSPRLNVINLACLQMKFDAPGSLRLVLIGQQRNSTEITRNILLEVEKVSASAKFDLMDVSEDSDFWLVLEVEGKPDNSVLFLPYQLMIFNLSVDSPACRLRGNTY